MTQLDLADVYGIGKERSVVLVEELSRILDGAVLKEGLTVLYDCCTTNDWSPSEICWAHVMVGALIGKEMKNNV